ncbi:RNA demethylase ALKBH10B [Coffea arabica]|uniref:RNA demethylase ALKBH10B n=1 Tax=Coffea arabica TaxID=13443 RepID=A0A6P6V3K6_COFAR|nr:RNA demethylase ALKBH10B-like [Coffea arabica]
MPPAAGVVAQSDRVPVVGPMVMPTVMQPAPGVMPEAYAKDAIIAWFRGEFAAANAIIDALCSHLKQLEGGGGSEYESVFAAIHRRRLNWIPILQMQKYYSIADVALELRKVAATKMMERERIAEEAEAKKKKKKKDAEEEMNKVAAAAGDIAIPLKEKAGENPVSEEEETISIGDENGNGEVVGDGQDSTKDDSLAESEITDAGSHEVPPSLENSDICSRHEECQARREKIKITKGFVAREPFKGHMVNVVRGLKLYEDIFNDTELSKLNDFVNEIRVAGQNGELSGETFILYNQQMKGNKREMIQLGVPVFGQINEATSKCPKSHIEPIPALLQGVVDHLIQWHIISDNKRPNGCIINFFDEGEYSQPFLKPPHLDQPISTLLLSQSTMAFGRTLVNGNEGNYRGPLMLPVKEGSLVVMRANSADVARHVMCSSPNKRVSITFFKVRMEEESTLMPTASPTSAMTVWQPGVPTPHPTANGLHAGFEAMDMIPEWGAMRTPVVMLAPLRPMVVSPRRVSRGGTGVFLPWTVGSRRPAKHLPPRAQKGRLLALPSPVEACKTDTNSDPRVSV